MSINFDTNKVILIQMLYKRNTSFSNLYFLRITRGRERPHPICNFATLDSHVALLLGMTGAKIIVEATATSKFAYCREPCSIFALLPRKPSSLSKQDGQWLKPQFRASACLVAHLWRVFSLCHCSSQ